VLYKGGTAENRILVMVEQRITVYVYYGSSRQERTFPYTVDINKNHKVNGKLEVYLDIFQ